jgi:hypothetical protein
MDQVGQGLISSDKQRPTMPFTEDEMKRILEAWNVIDGIEDQIRKDQYTPTLRNNF